MIDEDYIEEATRKVELAHDAEADLKRRGDFFRDELVKEFGCPPVSSRWTLPCKEARRCQYGIEEDDVAAWRQCWEAVWEAQW
jgi:hypothetical protein